MSSALLRQTLSGRSAALLALIAALSIFLAYAPTAHAQSSDAVLNAITLHVDGKPLRLTPTFLPGTNRYTTSVASSVPWLTVTPIASDSNATIKVDTPVLSSAIAVTSGAASPLLLLNIGANAIEIKVTAENDTTIKYYTVTVTRPNGGCGATTGIQAAQTRLLAECATLLGLKAELVGSGTDLNWAATVDIASWDGVVLSASRSSLNRLTLSANQLTGVIPPELGSLTNLQWLYLNDNRLTGSIPPELGSLTNLADLYLNNNRLTGGIPKELGSLTSLFRLYLNNNELTGSIPPELGDLKDLEDLYLNDNRLTGSIPPELGDLKGLYTLYLNDNRLTGSIPPELGSLTSLEDLQLNNNGLTGSIPPELANPEDLYYLYLNDNQLTGSIPPQLGNLIYLEDLDLSDNQLSGAIPVDLGNLTDLDRLWLHCNGLTGGIPTELSALNGNLNDGLWLQGNPLNPPTIPVGLTVSKVRLRGAQGSWTEAVWCGPPEFADSSATRTVVDGTASGQAIGDPVAAIDPDNRPLGDSQPLTYTLSGADVSHFAIDGATGQLRVGSAALDYANPADANMDNDYELTVTASDGVTAPTGGSDSIDVTVKVTRAAAPAASTDATLSGLRISAGTLSPAFAASRTTYTASVGNSVN